MNTNKTESTNRASSVVGIILCIVFGVMLVCNLTIIVKGTVAPEKPPSVLGVTPMVVLSGSMSGSAEDHIEVGDLIFVGKADPDKLAEGDVIAFMDGKVAVTHRILEVQTTAEGKLQYITKGDANNSADLRPVSEDQLVGKYMTRIPKLGDFALFLQTPLGMVAFIVVPLLAFILYDIIRRQQYAKREAARTDALEAELERLRKLAGEQPNHSDKTE